MVKLVLLRHGESIWNKENKFTGWTDIDLSKKGILEARKAGKVLKQKGYTFDIAYTSVLKRAIRTLWIVLDEMNLMWLPIINTWHLNERHYGALQGLRKDQMAKKYGEEQVHIWRRSYDIRPPALKTTEKIHMDNDPKYKNLSKIKIPFTECLQDTVSRVMPYWNEVILPEINLGKEVLIVAHGNSLRALVKHLDNISDEKIPELNIPTGIPLVYELDSNFKASKHYYLGNKKDIEKAMNAVKNQGKSKK